MDARVPTLQGQWSFFHFFGMCHLFLAGILTDVGPPYALELLFRVITPPSSTRTATCQTISEKNQMDIIPQVKIGEVALYIFPACSVQLGSLTPHSDRPPPPQESWLIQALFCTQSFRERAYLVPFKTSEWHWSTVFIPTD